MNSRALRRLAADHGALHNQPLPPNYLFSISSSSSTDDLTQLDILLAGPTHTPFAAGVWKLHLSIPPTYPQTPPTANFRTPIFHPNVDPNTGGVCVETLKRDWDSKLTLRDVLITISCLLIQPNPDSALNAEAGALIQENYESFARRAELMTGIHAVVQKDMREAVWEAQMRGQEVEEKYNGIEEEKAEARQEAPARRRRTIAKVRGMRRGDGSPSGAPTRRRQQHPAPAQPAAPPSQPFVFQTGGDDVFGSGSVFGRITPPQRTRPVNETIDEDSDMAEADQENDTARSTTKSSPPPRDARTPRRPHGTPVPLGELIMPEQDEEPDTSLEDSMDIEQEYPPSPRKSPSKSPAKPPILSRAESSRDATLRNAGSTIPNITPPNLNDRPLAANCPFGGMPSLSPRKGVGRGLFNTPPRRPGPEQPQQGTFGDESSFLDMSSFMKPATPIQFPQSKGKGVAKARSPSSEEKKRRQVELDAKLWELCGGDIKRWNRGDFDGGVIGKKAERW